MTPRGFVKKMIPVGESGVGGLELGPDSIAAGSDGNLWFTEFTGGDPVPMLGRITTSGTITEFPWPSGFVGGDPTPGPDGNLWFTSGRAIGRLSLARPGVAYVLSFDAGFAPKTRSGQLGGTAQWSFYRPRVHAVADSSGLGLFDSGPQTIVSFFSTRFEAAGVYPYGDSLNTGLVGKISVPLVASPTSGSTDTSFTITWASAPPAAGRVFDVQILRPGTTSYVNWMPRTTATSATFVPDAGRAPTSSARGSATRRQARGVATRRGRPSLSVAEGQPTRIGFEKAASPPAAP